MISVEITNCIVKKTLIGQGISVDMSFLNTFKQLGIPDSELFPHDNYYSASLKKEWKLSNA